MGEHKRRERIEPGPRGGDTPGMIEAEFQRWLATVYDRPLGPVQLQETRRAFFCGAQALVNVLATADGQPVEIGAAIDEALEVELLDFIRDLKEGRR